MNCEKCQNELEAYLGDRLSSGLKTQVEDHLSKCESCTSEYRLLILAERIIESEKEAVSNPFLYTRIMEGIESSTVSAPEPATIAGKLLKPVLITVALAAAIFLGIMAGNIYHPVVRAEKVPMELALMNDSAIESIDLLSGN